MDIKQLLEKMDQFAGQAVGQKPGDQWKGSDKAPPGKKLVGDSILKDLSKGPTAKSKEQELAEEWAAFNEEDLGVHPKRPARKNARHSRGHEPHPRYKTIKEYGKKAAVNFTADDIKELEGIKDLNTLKTRAFALISKPSERPMKPEKVQWFKGALERITNPTAVIKLMYDLLLSGEGFSVIGSRHSTNPNTYRQRFDEASDQEYTVIIDRKGREKPVSGTIQELLDYFGYTLETGKSYEHEKGRYKINLNPKNVGQLVDALNKAASNAAANSAPSTYYSVGEQQVSEGEETAPAALADPIVATVVKQMRPGLTGLDMGNEAFLYFAYELGKQRARDAWSDYLPAIRAEYEKGLNEGVESSRVQKAIEDFCSQHEGASEAVAIDAVDYLARIGQLEKFVSETPYLKDQFDNLAEGWESGPEEYEEPYDDADDAYDRQRQEKIDAEAEAEQAKRPQTKIYSLIGRGPDMEPNYKFPGEYDSQEDAIAARERLMADPKTPHPEHIGISSRTKYLDQAEESRGHKIVATKLKDIERAKKFASGELKIPTPQERRAELEKQSKEQVKEYGANTSTATMGGTQQQSGAMPDVSKLNAQQKQQLALQLDPQAMKKAAAATSQIKSATGSSASGPNLLKALNAASQGKSVSGQDMTALKPMMDVVKKAATDPKLAIQFKALASQAKQMK